MSTYVPISESAFRSFIESPVMKFAEITLDGVKERVWQRPIPYKEGWTGSYAVRVYSTVVGSATREVGEDAIRVMLIDLENDRPLSFEKRVHRTKNALSNLE